MHLKQPSKVARSTAIANPTSILSYGRPHLRIFTLPLSETSATANVISSYLFRTGWTALSATIINNLDILIVRVDFPDILRRSSNIDE